MTKTFTVAAVLAAAIAGGATLAGLSHAQETAPAPSATATTSAEEGTEVTIYRPQGCGCCDSYAEYLESHGFDVTIVDDIGFVARSIEAGVPAEGVGCHLAMIDGYAVSGLVPAEIIDRLLEERPEIAGITLPGMPANAPGMAPEKTGTLRVFAFGEDGVSVYSDE